MIHQMFLLEIFMRVHKCTQVHRVYMYVMYVLTPVPTILQLRVYTATVVQRLSITSIFHFVLGAAAAALLVFSVFFQSFACLFVSTCFPMPSLTLLVAILNRVAACALLKFTCAGLWFVAR